MSAAARPRSTSRHSPDSSVRATLHPWAVVLAAGESRRMGRPKALLPLASGETFLERLLETFALVGCDVLVVTGRHGGRIGARHPEALRIPHRRWRLGQFSSLRVGLRAALDRGATAVLLHPVDAPLVGAKLAAALLARLARGARAAVPVYRGLPGHPVALSRAAAATLLAAPADATLRELLPSLKPARVRTADAGSVANVNTPADYAQLLRASFPTAAQNPRGPKAPAPRRSRRGPRSKPG